MSSYNPFKLPPVPEAPYRSRQATHLSQRMDIVVRQFLVEIDRLNERIRVLEERTKP